MTEYPSNDNTQDPLHSEVNATSFTQYPVNYIQDLLIITHYTEPRSQHSLLTAQFTISIGMYIVL